MTRFEEKRQARIDRYNERAEKNEAIRDANGLHIFGEEHSGIPMGQPILVGHHSEKRHRRHLERLNRRVEKGMEAGRKAEHYRDKARAAENNSAIMSDDPEAVRKIKSKIQNLEDTRKLLKARNQMMRKLKTYSNAITTLMDAESAEESEVYKHLKNHWVRTWAAPSDEINRYYYDTSHIGPEIKRLKGRLAAIESAGEFTDFSINDIEIKMVDGQWQVHFPYKPNEETRKKLKSYPLSLKWSRWSTAWVRKHTASTGKYFLENLKATLKEASA